MAKDRFLIAPIKDGLRKDMAPWLLPESAFEGLFNAYVRDGKITKRFGALYTGTGTGETASLSSRLRIALTGGAAVGITNGAGAANGTVPGNIFKIGQLFSIGAEIFTVYQLGAPAAMLTTGGATTCTFNTTTGAYVFNAAPATTQIYFYPSEPVMGLCNFETNVLNNNPAIAFDTQFAYQYSGNSWLRMGPTAGSQFHGDNIDFFKAINWRGVTGDVNLLFVTNFNASIPAAATDDPMWYYNGTGIAGWTAFQPVFIVGANFVRSARIILPFKDRLILLNTIENDAGGGLGTNTQHVNRCRFSHNGSPIAASAFYVPNQVGSTGGGWIDAPTKEQIIGAEFIKDRLIVYFEKSTWELAYTGNALQPFIWQKINTELGSESTFSSVPFDKAVLNIGTTGIHACNGANVKRIDTEINDIIFKIRNDNGGPDRVAGVRDYFAEYVYWTFPSSNSDQYASTYPNKILLYGYVNGTWAINEDSITAFGFFEQQTGITWDSTDLSWWNCNFTWDDGTIQPKSREIVAGNQEGFVFKINTVINTNAGVLQITNMTEALGIVTISVIDHNLDSNSFIKITSCQGVTGVNDKNYKVTATSNDEIEIEEPDFAGVYLGGGTITRVSRIAILTKRYNPYIGKGSNVSIDSVDFAVKRTSGGQITVDYSPSGSHFSMVYGGIASGTILGNNILETSPYALIPLEEEQQLLWHRVYLCGEGDAIQLLLSLTDEQMIDPTITESGLTIEGFILNVSPTGRIS